eukprot:jgi/Galph1/6023/GphlegSOOS_G4669.1
MWTSLPCKHRRLFSAQHNSRLEQDEIMSSFMKENTSWEMDDTIKKGMKPNKSVKANGTTSLPEFVVVKKNPRQSYRRGRVAKLVLRCAGEVHISENLRQAVIIWNVRSGWNEQVEMDYQHFAIQLDNLCGLIQMQMSQIASLRRIPKVSFQQSIKAGAEEL